MRMRIPLIAISLWMFVLMTIFGVIGYTYVLWSQYWRVSNERKQLMSQKNINFLRHYGLHSNDHLNRVNPVVSAKIISLHNLTDIPTDKLMSKISTYKTQLIIQLRKAQMVAGNVLFHKGKQGANTYKVNFKKQKGKIPEKSSVELMCEIKKAVRVEMLSQNTEPFNRLGFSKRFPESSLFETIGSKNTCAIVSSAGSMHRSKLGKEIGKGIYLIFIKKSVCRWQEMLAVQDSHDLVLRFNTAPSEGYEDDVGIKTNIRFLNSQVVSKPEFEFFTSAIYRNVTLIVWDPSKYHAPLEEWYEHPDFDLFTPYWMYRELYPSQPFYIMHPEVAWTAWDFIQSNIQVPVEPNPPSSGFLGILTLLHICDTIDIYEYVPSMRLTKRCHYFDVHEDIGCTLGDWHPLASEKILTMAMNDGSDIDIFATGKVTLTGLNKIKC